MNSDFAAFSSGSAAVPDAYKRHLINALRDAFDFPGVPIRLTPREKDNPYAGKRPWKD
jgi:GTPase